MGALKFDSHIKKVFKLCFVTSKSLLPKAKALYATALFAIDVPSSDKIFGAYTGLAQSGEIEKCYHK